MTAASINKFIQKCRWQHERRRSARSYFLRRNDKTDFCHLSPRRSTRNCCSNVVSSKCHARGRKGQDSRSTNSKAAGGGELTSWFYRSSQTDERRRTSRLVVSEEGFNRDGVSSLRKSIPPAMELEWLPRLSGNKSIAFMICSVVPSSVYIYTQHTINRFSHYKSIRSPHAGVSILCVARQVMNAVVPEWTLRSHLISH